MNIIKRIARMLRDGVTASQKAGSGLWSKIGMFFDYVYCKVRFHVSIEEYLAYRFYNYKDRYRKNFLLGYHQKNKFKTINAGGFTRSKYGFYKKIPDFFEREIILAPSCGEECFLEFAKKHNKIIAKPDTGTCGNAISIFVYTNDDEARKYFAGLTENTIFEEFICQHEKMNEMNPYSVNTIRIVSLLVEEKVEIVSATLRTGGQAGVFVDNLRKDGIGAQIDVSTGIISTCGFDYNDHLYVKHPVSGTQFLGFNIPNWDQAITLVKSAHKRLPQCKLFGWDIAITQTGVDIVEANNRPGTPIMQMVDLVPKGEKVIRVLREAKKARRK